MGPILGGDELAVNQIIAQRLQGAGGLIRLSLGFEIEVRETLINWSFRRRPESMWLILLDPGIRRDDENGVNQSFLRQEFLILRQNIALV